MFTVGFCAQFICCFNWYWQMFCCCLFNQWRKALCHALTSLRWPTAVWHIIMSLRFNKPAKLWICFTYSWFSSICFLFNSSILSVSLLSFLWRMRMLGAFILRQDRTRFKSLRPALDLTTGINIIILIHPASGPLWGFTVVNNPLLGS